MTMVSDYPAWSARKPVDHAALAESIAARRDRRQQPRFVPAGRLAALFPPAAARGAGPLLPGKPARTLLVGDQAQGHHRPRNEPSKRSRRVRRSGGIVLRDRYGELELPMFIAMDPPKHDVQRKVVQPIVSPENLANFEGLIRSARARHARRPAARRDLRLGGQGLDRAHLPDAGDPVRLSVRGPAQAQLLVGRLDRHSHSGAD